MNPTLYTYTAYIILSIGLTVWVGRTLHKNGRAFLVDVFAGRADLADSVNHLLVVGFYLVNLGYVCLALKLDAHVATAIGSVEALSYKVGVVLVVLGTMHFFNLFLFSRIRAHHALRNSPPPVQPDHVMGMGPTPEAAP